MEVTTMRWITKNPRSVIPNIKESDVAHNLIVVSVDNRRAFIIQYLDAYDQRVFNWFGEDATGRYPYGYQWYFEQTSSLLNFLTTSWIYWENTNSIIKMYILEFPEDVETLCNNPAFTDLNFSKVIRKKFIAIKEGNL